MDTNSKKLHLKKKYFFYGLITKCVFGLYRDEVNKGAGPKGGG